MTTQGKSAAPAAAATRPTQSLLQLGADTSGVDEYNIDYNPNDPKIATASRPSADKEQPLTSFQRLLGFTSGMGGRLISSVLLAMAGVLFGLIPYVVLGRILGQLLAETLTGSSLILQLIIAAVAYLISRLLLLTSTLMSHRVAYRTLYRVRVALTQKLGRIPLGRIVDTPSGRLKKVFVEDIQACELPLAHLLPEVTAHLFGPIVVITYLFVLDWRLALGSLLPIAAGLLMMSGMFINYRERFARFNETNRQMNATIVEYVQGIAVIKAFNQSSTSFAKYLRDVLAFRDATVSWFRATQVFSVMSWVLVPSSLVVLVPLGGHLVATGQTSLDTLLLAIVLSIALGPSLITLASFSDSISTVFTALDEAMIWFEEPEMVRPTEPVNIQEPKFELENVKFSYRADGSGEAALQGIDLDCPQGSFTALVGPSGAGKSTAGRLLAGYWEADSGKIEFGGVAMERIPQAQLMENLSYVTQDNYLFDTSIAENLRLAKADATEAEMYAALDAAGCTDFMNRLPDGLETRVGGAGTHLSGGERQRITIARALLKDAPVVILDEATSYLDPASEAKVQAAITKLTAGKTLVVIAHRLSTVTEADRLYVLKHGQVAQQGTHEELRQTPGLYAELWNTHQAARRAAGQEME